MIINQILSEIEITWDGGTIKIDTSDDIMKTLKTIRHSGMDKNQIKKLCELLEKDALATDRLTKEMLKDGASYRDIEYASNQSRELKMLASFLK